MGIPRTKTAQDMCQNSLTMPMALSWILISNFPLWFNVTTLTFQRLFRYALLSKLMPNHEMRNS
jgi:hypothetical protein